MDMDLIASIGLHWLDLGQSRSKRETQNVVQKNASPERERETCFLKTQHVNEVHHVNEMHHVKKYSTHFSALHYIF